MVAQTITNFSQPKHKTKTNKQTLCYPMTLYFYTPFYTINLITLTTLYSR